MHDYISEKVSLIVQCAIFAVNVILIIVSIFCGVGISDPDITTSQLTCIRISYIIAAAFMSINFASIILMLLANIFIWNFVDVLDGLFITIAAITLFGCIGAGITAACILDGARRWLLFTACISQALLYLLVMLAPYVWHIVSEFFINFFTGLFNIGYTGEPVMGFGRKVAEIFLQIALIPISAIVWFCGICIFMGLNFVGETIVEGFFFGLKGQKRTIVSRYNVGASDEEYEVAKEHQIKDNDGNVIGVYETTEKRVRHDDGNRVTFNFDSWEVYVSLFLALPLRILSLLASILALCVPHMYVSAVCPKTDECYDETIYRIFDVVSII